MKHQSADKTDCNCLHKRYKVGKIAAFFRYQRNDTGYGKIRYNAEGSTYYGGDYGNEYRTHVIF